MEINIKTVIVSDVMLCSLHCKRSR